MIVCTVNALFDVANVSVISASQTAFVAAFALQIWWAIGSESKLTSRSASHSSVEVVHKVLRVVKVIPAGEADLAICITSLARIVAFKHRKHDEIIELVHDVGLVCIPVRLNDKTITWFVVNSILHIFKFDSDRSTILVTWSSNKNVGDCDCTRVSVDNTWSQVISFSSHSASSELLVDQRDLLGISHLDTTSSWERVHWCEVNLVHSYSVRYKWALLDRVNW